MIALSELLRVHVRPRPDDPLAALLLRADNGARIFGALCVASSAHEDVNPAVMRSVLALLQRPTTGRWMYATRVCLLATERGPAKPWRALLDRSALARPVDQWLSPYEVSLRHSGRQPPEGAREALVAQLVAELNALCDRALDASNPAIIGTDSQTVAWEEVPCAPLLERTPRAEEPAALRLWERHDGQHAEWRAIPGGERIFGAVGDSDGIWARLLQTREAPLDACLGIGAPVEERPQSEHPLVFPMAGDIGLAAERLAARWRGSAHAVLVLPLGLGDLPAERLDALLAYRNADPAGSLARAAVRKWRKRHAGCSVTVLLTGEVEGSDLPGLAERLAPEMSLACVVRADVEGRWLPVLRRVLEIQPALDLTVEPDVVAAFRGTGPDRWIHGFRAHFSVQGPGEIDELLETLAGRVDPLSVEGERALQWWANGDLVVQVSGRPELRHPAWRAFLGPWLDLPRPQVWADAWDAGLALYKACHARGGR